MMKMIPEHLPRRQGGGRSGRLPIRAVAVAIVLSGLIALPAVAAAPVPGVGYHGQSRAKGAWRFDIAVFPRGDRGSVSAFAPTRCRYDDGFSATFAYPFTVPIRLNGKGTFTGTMHVKRALHPGWREETANVNGRFAGDRVIKATHHQWRSDGVSELCQTNGWVKLTGKQNYPPQRWGTYSGKTYDGHVVGPVHLEFPGVVMPWGQAVAAVSQFRIHVMDCATGGDTALDIPTGRRIGLTFSAVQMKFKGTVTAGYKVDLWSEFKGAKMTGAIAVTFPSGCETDSGFKGAWSGP